MSPKSISQAELDSHLDGAADEPERFEAIAEDLIQRFDADGIDLEIADPSSWRRQVRGAAGGSRPTFIKQFRSDVESIVLLDREDEARLARRIEFARLRLMKTQEALGLEPDGDCRELLSELPHNPSEYGALASLGIQPPDGLTRRALELHSLRVELVERNLYLVLINVERYSHTGASRVDLIQEGCLSLFRAVDGFDWRRGLLFRTYAVHWLNQAFRNHLYNFGNTVRVPVYLQKALKHIGQAQARLGDPKASVQEIAADAELNANLVETALTAARSAYSIDAGVAEDGEGTRLRDLLVVPNDEGPYSTRLEGTSLEQGLSDAMEKLSERESLVLQMRFGLQREREHTLAEVAGELGVSVERVRQIQVRALSKLNTPVLRRELDPWLN